MATIDAVLEESEAGSGRKEQQMFTFKNLLSINHDVVVFCATCYMDFKIKAGVVAVCYPNVTSAAVVARREETDSWYKNRTQEDD
jgi:hypothetical protein